MYQCIADIFGTIPIAEALLSKGAMLGTILAFMIGSNYTEFTVNDYVKKGNKTETFIYFYRHNNVRNYNSRIYF